MKPARTKLYIIFMFLAISVFLTGCMARIYTPTADNGARMSNEEARSKLTRLIGNDIFIRGRLCRIVDVRLNPDSVDITYERRGPFGIVTGTEVVPVYFRFIEGVSTADNRHYFIEFSNRTSIAVNNSNDAISFAQAFYALGRNPEGYNTANYGNTPKPDPAAQPAFSGPELPEEARMYAVQGDFAVEKKNLPAAAELYKKALDIAPWWPEGHFKRAHTLADMEKYEEAVAEMKKFLSLAPHSKEAREAQDDVYKWEGAANLSK